MKRLILALLAASCLVRAGSLMGSVSNLSSVNLTTEGQLDWAILSLGNYAQKNVGTHYFVGGPYTLIGTSGDDVGNDNPLHVSWTDGDPAFVASNADYTGKQFTDGVGNGYSFTVSADATAKVLVAHLGGWNSSCTITAHLSDGSAPDYTFTTQAFDPSAGAWSRDFSIKFKADSAGQTLTITWVVASTTDAVSGDGEAHVAAASLSLAPTVKPFLLQPIFY